MPIPIEFQFKNGRSRIARRVPTPQAHSLPREDSKVYAASGNCAETQHICSPVIHSWAQREDIPVPSGQ